MKELVKHPFFRRAHPREEHFVPIYIAAGAGGDDGEKASVLADIHSAITIAFGV
jgi:aromatic ring-opening dioxygenase catalytic subunit (LigB family)